MRVRPATTRDRDAIAAVHLSAFTADERDRVAQLALKLLDEDTTPATLSFIAEADGGIVGHIAFSPVWAGVDGDGAACIGYTLAPLGVQPAYQKRGIGSALVQHGIRQLTEAGVGLLLVYGDPAYYGRFGFNTDHAQPYNPPYPLMYPFGWLAMKLGPGVPVATTSPLVFVASLRDPALW